MTGVPQPADNSDEISPELMRYLDRDYWEKKEKEKAELKAKALSGVNTASLGETKEKENLAYTTSTEVQQTSGILTTFWKYLVNVLIIIGP